MSEACAEGWRLVLMQALALPPQQTVSLGRGERRVPTAVRWQRGPAREAAASTLGIAGPCEVRFS